MSRRKLTDEFYEQLARDYNAAAIVGFKIYPTLTRHYDVPRNTMARWLKEVARRGLINTRPKSARV